MSPPFCLAAFVAAFSWPAEAQGIVCAERDSFLKYFKTKYSEVPVAVGVGSAGGLVEVLSSKAGDSWSIIITSPEGRSCLVSTGWGWRVLEPTKPGEAL